jgi:hypothetical protein
VNFTGEWRGRDRLFFEVLPTAAAGLAELPANAS